MSIYTIGDLHLSFHENKPMNIFGDNWKNHEEKIRANWLENVKNDDLVIIPGDFSWSTYLKDTYEDFKYINSLPGKKLLLKGNHDYWWTTVASMRKFLNENGFLDIDFIYNNAYEHENVIIAGTRGWSRAEEGENIKILKREVMRLELSIQKAVELVSSNNLQSNTSNTCINLQSNTSNTCTNNKEIIVFMHYPPISTSDLINNETNEFIKIMQKYNIKRCYYGHLHSLSIKEAIEETHFGIDFKLVSADALDFKLLKIDI